MHVDLQMIMISCFLGLIGLLLGNFVTTAIYRIPKGITIAGFDKRNTQPPFCGVCRHFLRFYEYLPLLSWITTHGQCNYCGVSINRLYMAIEISGCIGATILYWLIGLSEIYVLLLFDLAITLLAIGLFIEEQKIYWSVVFVMTGLGVVYNALVYGTIADCAMRQTMVVVVCISLSNFRLFDRHLNYDAKRTLQLLLPVAGWCNGLYIALYIGLFLCCDFILLYITIRQQTHRYIVSSYIYLSSMSFLVIALSTWL